MRSAQNARTATARFGELGRSFGVLIPAGRRYRKRLGITLADQYLIEQVLYYYRDAGLWPSVGQSALAKDLGISRSTVTGQLLRLRKHGLVATRPDPRYGTSASKTLRYCVHPYLAALAMLEGVARYNRAFWAEGNDRLLQFGIAAERGEWVWGIDGFRTPPHPAAEVLDLFVRNYRLSETGPRSYAVSADQFIAESSERDLLARPTQVESHPEPTETVLLVPPTQVEDDTNESVHEELETPVHKELKTSDLNTSAYEHLKTLGHKPNNSAHEQLEPSVDNELETSGPNISTHNQLRTLAGEPQTSIDARARASADRELGARSSGRAARSLPLISEPLSKRAEADLSPRLRGSPRGSPSRLTGTGGK